MLVMKIRGGMVPAADRHVIEASFPCLSPLTTRTSAAGLAGRGSGPLIGSCTNFVIM